MLKYELLGHYTIQQHLGKRAGQETLLALDQRTQDLVVIKLLTFNSELNWETFKLFEREARVLKELQHPAIPSYLDYFDIATASGKGFALVQSYIDALSLEEHVKSGRTFSEIELKQLAKEVLEVLTYLHNRYPPVIHRDIKPSNILLSNRPDNYMRQVYLVDLGAVQAATSEDGTRTIVGTYGYMPPEQFGERAVPASDLYSLGATLIYLASGQHPADLPQNNLRICFEKNVNLSPAFIDWLQWMTEPSLEERLASATDALEALENETLRKQKLVVPAKPKGSRVRLTKQSNFIEIFIPPKYFSGNPLLLPQSFLSLSFLCFFLWGTLESRFHPVMLMFSGLLFWINCRILFKIFGQVRLRIDEETISRRIKLFGIELNLPKPAARNEIIKLERTHTYIQKSRKGGQTVVEPQINIWTGTKKFSIGGNGFSIGGNYFTIAENRLFTITENRLLTEIELDWIAYELSDWLDLPIIKEY